jgi:hypothetical protein
MKKIFFISAFLIFLILLICGCASIDTREKNSTSVIKQQTNEIVPPQFPKTVIQSGESGNRYYSINSDKTDNQLDLFETADMAVAEWYNSENRQIPTTFMVGNLKKMPDDLAEIEDIWILTKNENGQSLAIVPRDHAEILKYENVRVYTNGVAIKNPAALDDLLNCMIDLNQKIRTHNNWEEEHPLSLSGSIQDKANLVPITKANWEEKVVQEKEIDGLIHIINIKMHNASFARYPLYAMSDPWTSPTTITPSPATTNIFTTSKESPSTSRSFIAATMHSSPIKQGDKISMAGTAAGGAKFVYVTISSLDGQPFVPKRYEVPVYSDGYYALKLDSFAFSKGLYGVVLELPSGESVRLQFVIE